MTGAPFDSGAELRLRRLAEQVHHLGAVALLHALRELSDDAAIEITLKRYARLDPDFIRGMGGDRFPAPLRQIAGGAA